MQIFLYQPPLSEAQRYLDNQLRSTFRLWEPYSLIIPSQLKQVKNCNRFKVLLTETLKIWSKEVPMQVKEVISLDNENKPVSKIAKTLGLANSTV